METRFVYSGTGSGLFVKLFVGVLLCIVTIGIYTPWFIVSLYRYITENTTMKTPDGDVRFSFRGEGAELFVTLLVGGLLSLVTFGIYYPWFMVNLSKYFASHLFGTDSQGREYTGTFRGTGGQMFGIVFVGTLLTIVTLGIYMPWFACKLVKYCTESTDIVHDGQVFGTLQFKGEGAALFGVYLVGMVLSGVTLGIYYFWYEVNMIKFFTENTTVQINGRQNRLKFVGTGGTNFGINVVGTILSVLTLGIYGFWYMTNLIRFRVENTIASAD